MAPNYTSDSNVAEGIFPSPSDPETDLLGRLRHDLKGPLTVIRGQIQLLLRRVARLEGIDPEERARLLERGDRIDAAIIGLAVQIEQIGRDLSNPGAPPPGGDGVGGDGPSPRHRR